MDYAIHVVTNAGTLWRDVEPAQRVRLQAFLFPEGLRWKRDGFVRTERTGLPFSGLEPKAGDENRLVALRGFEPRFDG